MQGTSSFAVLAVDGYQLSLSYLGPFLELPEEAAPPEWVERCRRAAATAGWTPLTGATLEVEFPGLDVYYFGSPDSLRVRELLYHWQD